MSTPPAFFFHLALANDADGNLHLICVDSNHHVFLAATQPAGDDEWTVAKANALAFQSRQFGGLAVGIGGDRKLQVVGLSFGDDKRLYLAAYLDTDRQWKAPPDSVPSPLGDPNREYASVAVASGNLGNLCVVALGQDQQLYAPAYQDHLGIWWNGQSPGALGDPTKQYSAFAVARGVGGLQLLALDDAQQLFLVAQQNDATGVWTAPTAGINPVGGGDPRYVALAAAQGFDGTLRVVALGRDGKVYEAAYQDDAGGWHTSGQPLGDPNAVYASLAFGRGPKNTLQVVCIGTDGGAYTAVTLDADGQWHTGDAMFNPLGGRGDREYQQLALGVGDAGALQVVALEWRPFLGLPYLAAILDANGVWQPGRSLSQGDPNRWNLRLTDVRQAFDAIPAKGVNHTFSGHPIFVFEPISHIQGIARYGSYYLATHNSVIASTGDILLYSIRRGEYLDIFPTAVDGYRHPGGCQVIGDYLAVPVEKDTESFINFYYLGTLDSQAKLHPLTARIHRNSHKAGAAGITDVGRGADRRYVVAVYDDSKVTIYRSNGYALDNVNCAFDELFTSAPGGRGADNLCMLTDVGNQVYFVAMTSTGSPLPDKDWAELYRVDFENERFVLQETREFHSTGEPPRNDIHFRWGAGLTITSATTIELYCTKRHVANMQVNTFGG